MTTATTTSTARLLNPATYDGAEFDEATRRLLRATIEWFEAKGKTRLTEEDRAAEWYADFVEFLRAERAFATLLTPARDADGDPDKRWDTARNAVFNEILGFYGLPYWYAWQVTILGLGPIWQSDNDAARARAAALLEDGAVFAFGLSEREHGADIYSTDMVLTPDGDGLPRQRRQVLHRQRQRGRHGVGVRPPRRRRRAPRATSSSRPTAPTRRTSCARTSCTPRCTSAPSTSRTTRSAPRTSCTPAWRPSRPR